MSQADEPSNAARAFSEVDAGWEANLVKSDKGVLWPVLENVVSILRHDEAWAGVIALDEFSGLTRKLKSPPYDRGEIGEWTDLDDNRLELWLAQRYQLRGMHEKTLIKGVSLAADGNRFHAVRDYLRGLTWDSVPRLRYMLSSYFGAQSDDAKRQQYVEAVAVKWMVGAVARVFRPGVKFDYVPILEGEQGIMKSTALKALFDPWFTDAAFEIGSADGSQIIRGMWCVELAELDGYNRAAADRSKGFFSRQIDRYRNPYGRKPVDIPRQGVFAGSVNHSTYLKDESGNRRFWPVMCRFIEIDELRERRDQLWAEAVHEFHAGTEYWVRASDKGLYEAEQDDRYVGDAYEGRIRDWLEGRDTPASGRALEVSMNQLLEKALKLDVRAWSAAEQSRVGRIMARIARNPADAEKPFWVKSRPGTTNRQYVWTRTDAGLAELP